MLRGTATEPPPAYDWNLWDFSVYRGVTQIYLSAGIMTSEYRNRMFAFNFTDEPAAGTYTYYLKVKREKSGYPGPGIANSMP